MRRLLFGKEPKKESVLSGHQTIGTLSLYVRFTIKQV